MPGKVEELAGGSTSLAVKGGPIIEAGCWAHARRISVRLHRARVVPQVPFGVLRSAVGRVEEHGGRLNQV
jgi:hypothetical protein